MHYFRYGAHVMLLRFLRLNVYTCWMLYLLLFFLSALRVLYLIKIVVPVQSLLLSPKPWSIPTKYIDFDVRGPLCEGQIPRIKIREVVRALLIISCTHDLNTDLRNPSHKTWSLNYTSSHSHPSFITKTFNSISQQGFDLQI